MTTCEGWWLLGAHWVCSLGSSSNRLQSSWSCNLWAYFPYCGTSFRNDLHCDEFWENLTHCKFTTISQMQTFHWCPQYFYKLADSSYHKLDREKKNLEKMSVIQKACAWKSWRFFCRPVTMLPLVYPSEFAGTLAHTRLENHKSLNCSLLIP